MTSISLPYYGDAALLPTHLPTRGEIQNSQDVFCNQTARRVVGVGVHFVVKYGLAVDLIEGETMLFIQQTTQVPVPRIYALFKDPTDHKSYIIMERMVGKNLASEWPVLSQAEKRAIATKLRASFDEIRTLQSPGVYGSIDKRPLLDNVFWTDGTVDPIAGPCETEADLNNALIKKYVFNNLPQGKVGFYKRVLRSIKLN